MQRDDLARAYYTKADDELLVLAADPDQLTPEARGVLRNELARRGIEPAVSADVVEDQRSYEKISPSKKLENPSNPGRFVAEVVELYQRHFWLFIKLTAPAVVFGYIAAILRRREVHEITRQLFNRGISDDARVYRLVIVEGGGVNLVANLLTWIVFSLSFAAICSAAAQFVAGGRPTFLECFTEVRRRIGPFLRLSSVLFLLGMVAFTAITLLSSTLFPAMNRRHIHPSMFAIQIVSFAVWGLAALLLSRFSLAMPAVVLDGYPVGRAMFRSDELTAGKWRILAILTAKAVLGGYIAGMLPFWLAGWVWMYVQIPWWLLDLASIAGVTAVEPILFIGFALLYEQTSQQPSTHAALAV